MNLKKEYEAKTGQDILEPNMSYLINFIPIVDIGGAG